MFDGLFDELVDQLFYGVVPDHPAVLYLLPTLLLGGGLAAVADPFPLLALAVGAVASVAVLLAYEHTGLQKESTGNERSTADWIVTGAFLLVVAGIVIVAEVDAIDPGVSAMQVLGAVTGLLAGASVVEWLLPTLSSVAER
ncbi:hypothetical protein B4589_003990 [Halolamina sp. CBA1230]|uniref:hypothetical protein n=1 Tax=Halolamina sp. CBA1230 TaxID=1853690 RepID=UPI0009A14D58|nr:hypothetical protein [Halolamina sp. CBA1230]QKY19578.1 hypothetical protein B4589_003990 [Halolamina sp. CBA1230]